MWQAWYEYRIDYALFALVFFAGHAYLMHRVRRQMPPDSSHGELPFGLSNQAMKNRFRLSCLVLILLLVAGFVAVELVDRYQRSRLRQQVSGFAPTYAEELEQLGHQQIDPGTPADDPVYLRMIEAQKRWLRVNSQVSDIYTMRRIDPNESRRLQSLRSNTKGLPYQLIVDSETDYDRNGVFRGPRESRTHIGEIFYDSSQAEISQAFQGSPTFAEVPSQDRWGIWVTAYAPLRNDDGEVEALVGVDFPAESYVQSIIIARVGMIGIVATILSLYLGGVVSIGMLKIGIVAKERNQVLLQDQRDLATKAAAQARQAAVTKNQFLANMSHELRTPMHGILGTTDLMLRSKLTDEQGRYMRMIQSSAKGLLTVLNDILDFSKVDSGQMRLELVPFRLSDLLQQTMDAVGGLRDENVALEFSSPEDVPDLLLGDPTRLRQVLINLVGNALKFTSKGQVTLSIRRDIEGTTNLDSPETETARIVFVIADTGIGMTQQQQDRIFEAFMQADSSTTRRFGGTGLGLAISSQLVELMGGQLEVCSVPEQGSNFRFDIPLQVPTPEQTKTFEAVQRQEEPVEEFGTCDRPCDLLLVEDGAINRAVAEAMLLARGHRVTSVPNAMQAIERLRQRSYDLVLMDVQMPEMDGLTATKIIREELPAPSKDVPIIALTAHAMTEDRNRCLAAGMDACLTKPYPPQLLFQTIEAFDCQRALEDDDLMQPLPRGGAATLPSSVSSTSSDSSLTNDSSAAMDESPGLDPTVVMQNVGGDLDVLRSLVDTIRKELPPQIEALQTAMNSRDRRQIERAAHQLRGTAAAIGATQAQKIADTMETFCQTQTSEQERMHLLRDRAKALIIAFDLAQLELDEFLNSSSGREHPGIESP
ncbi:response regulator [Rhodopirellula sp. JC740]|uniref:histidine kinase n=1 Tax=Rhodopirellula halodulae TaxID=2894198 RepID=A0ABS8NFV8_9BACT|nr:ATP-binding protein [Rhodopirellula sp. JC740]MCC9642324.1 response regulator [Rhodopirellula sp. JC740]